MKEGRWGKLAREKMTPEFWTALAKDLGVPAKSNREHTAQALRGSENERYETSQIVAALLDRIEALEGKKATKK